MIPRHTFNVLLLWAILRIWALGDACSIKAAWEQAGYPLSLEGLYHLLQRWRQRLWVFRGALCRLIAPPAGRHADPIKQTVEHFQAAFPSAKNALCAFQIRFQSSLAG